MPASTAPLQNLSSKLTKARHCLHNVNLNVESIKNDCDGLRREVEKSDREISAMEQEEERLKLQYVESKLQYEKLHASKYAKQQELKRAREDKTRTGKERDMARQFEWAKAHEEHKKVEEMAETLAAKLEAIEKDKEANRRRLQANRTEVERYTAMYEDLKRELQVIQASAAAV